ncbi:MAG: hypothetical protein PGN23_06685 [Sphingomonas adhaesiva]|uniref:hypothetical protein n=1 Tax=Sphingomonas adhaesiva TaxID=28212 RepID=UPI002FF53F97
MATTHTSLRIDDEMMTAIDASRAERTGNVSRNTWIAEAIAEKLQRERQPTRETADA